MYYLKLCNILVILQTIKIVCGIRSFVVVLDTTESMLGEKEIIRRNFHFIADVLRDNFEMFGLIPFQDHGIGTPLTFSSPFDMVNAIRDVSVTKGGDCPEDALSGIQEGLEISYPDSPIFVFTDAYSNDDSKFRNIEALCRSKRNQVVILLSGKSECNGKQEGNIAIYYDIAKSCSGVVLDFNALNLGKGFHYIREMAMTDWNDVTNYDVFRGTKTFQVTLDTFTTDLLVVVSGYYPTLQMVDSEGKSPHIDKIVDTLQTLVVRVANQFGDYQVSVASQSGTSLTFFKKTQLPIQYGFSTKLPRSLLETSQRPMPGRANYVLFVVSPALDIQITSVEIQMTDRDEKKIVSVTESETKKGYYLANVFFEPERSFRFVIRGRDSLYKEFTGSTKNIYVQTMITESRWFKPEVEIIGVENYLVDFNTNATIACKVRGYPKPEIQWEIEPETVLTKEEFLLEIPATYISYVTINATRNSTLYCKARNTDGDDVKSMQLSVNRTFTFDVIDSPKDKTIEYGTEGKLYCKVDAYPEAEIKWYHNDTLIDYLDNMEVLPEENALVIKNMTLEEVGSYQCEASNSVRIETFTAMVTISGLEAPEVEIENAEIFIQPGEKKSIECRILKGNPPPKITWFKITEDSTLNELDVYDDKLQIEGKLDHTGSYKCVASNIMGENTLIISVEIQYPPKITDLEDNAVVIMHGNPVELKCEVDAVPEATVRWEMTQDDVIMTLDHRHTMDERNTHRFIAQESDSGVYHCIAENVLGKIEKSVVVTVLVPPFIEPPESTLVEVMTGSDVTFPCNVLHGNPVPTTKWEFIAPDSRSSLLKSGSSLSTYLHLERVSSENEGNYFCIVENSVGNDNIKIYLKVK